MIKLLLTFFALVAILSAPALIRSSPPVPFPKGMVGGEPITHPSAITPRGPRG